MQSYIQINFCLEILSSKFHYLLVRCTGRHKLLTFKTLRPRSSLKQFVSKNTGAEFMQAFILLEDRRELSQHWPPQSRYAKHFVGHTRHDMIQTFAKKLLMHETAERVLAPGTLTLRYAQKLFLHLHYCQLGVGVFSTGTQSQLDFINEIMCFKKIDPFTGLTLTCTYLKYEFSEYFF